MDLRNQQIKETYGNLATINTVAGTPTTGVLQNGAGSNVTAMTLEGSLTAQQLNADNLRLDGNTISSTDTNGNILIQPNGTGDVVINDSGADVDFRVEGDTDQNLLFVDASADKVGIGTNAPDYKLRMNFTVPTSAENGIKLNDGTRSALYAFTGDTYSYRGVGANTLLAYSGDDIAFLTDKVSNSKITFHNTNNEVMRIDSSGNVGIGVTPKAWGSGGNLVLPTSGSLQYNGANGNILANAYFDGGWKYAANGFAGYYALTSGEHQWFTAVSGTADGAVTFTERVKFRQSEAVINDASEDYDFRVEGATDTHLIFADAGNDRVGIGTSSPAELLHVDGTIRIDALKTNATNQNGISEFRGSVTGGGASVLNVYNTAAASGDASPPLTIIKSMTTTTSSARFVQFSAGDGATPMGGIVGNGASNVQFATISDIREKQNIKPIDGSLDKILSLNPVEFDWIKSNEHVKGGFIAQEVELVFPEFVIENISSEGEEARKGLTGGMTGGIIAHLVKAIQELEARVKELEAK